MTERKRLIELLEIRHFLTAETTADFLMDNGVTIPVRCSECFFSRKVDDREPKYKCVNICRDGCSKWLGSDDYCSYGERREDK